MKRLIFILLIVFSTVSVSAQSPITHDISSASLIIPSNSTDNYIVTGTTISNYIEVNPPYNGTITLSNLNIRLNGMNSPMAIRGVNNLSNLTPASNVDIILEGDNNLTYTGMLGYAAFQVDQGTQINISAIDPANNASGKLNAVVTDNSPNGGGAAIGALNRYNFDWLTDEATSTAPIIGGCPSQPTAGGNIIISSGTINAQGAHGAGIGGGVHSYYDGMIVIYGGVVNAESKLHAAGIGSGCPNMSGVIPCYTPNSAIIVLPPATISAIGSGYPPPAPRPDLALAGSSTIVYIGDPAKPKITVHTEDYEPNVNIYVDLSQGPDILRVTNATVEASRLDINKVKFGTADGSGIYQFHGVLQDLTTFFTDANSTQPGTEGRPYLPKAQTLPDGTGVNRDIILELLPTDLSLVPYPSTPLDEGYSASEATENSYRVQLNYNDLVPMNNVVFDLANGADFTGLQFFAADGTTTIPAPSTLNQGDVFFISVPLKQGKTINEYSDVLRIIGEWNGYSTGYIRQVITQIVTRTIDAEICEGESYFFDGQSRTTSDTYTATVATPSGTDVIITLNLTVNPPLRRTINKSICIYETYDFYGTLLNTAVTGLEHRFTNTSSCDSIVTLNLTIADKPIVGAISSIPTICEGENINLIAPAVTDGGANIISQRWLLDGKTFDPGTNISYENNNQILKYIAENSCGTASSNEIVLSVHRQPELDISEYNICLGGHVQLQAPASGTYLWLPIMSTSRNPTVSPTETTIYTLRLTNDICTANYPVTVNVRPSPEEVTIKQVGISTVRIIADMPYTYRLNQQEPTANTVFNGLSDGHYSLEVRTDFGCSIQQSFVIYGLQIPDYFSPNDDGKNDVWKIKNLTEFPDIKVSIYDRSGKLLDILDANRPAWDGTFNGREMPSTDYWYLLEIPEFGERQTGHITLKR